MADKSNETEKGHNEKLKEVQKANIHNGTEEQEDESPGVEGEIKEEGGLKVEFFPFNHKKKQSSKNNEEEKSDKSKFGYINKNGVFWSQARMRIVKRLKCFLFIESLAICNW